MDAICTFGVGGYWESLPGTQLFQHVHNNSIREADNWIVDV